MHLIRLLRRLRVEAYHRSINLTVGPHPECPTCAGHGGIVIPISYCEAETELCDCWDPAPIVRIPLWFRRTERVPF
ncbi:hypothetical protein [Streptomyces lunaelactis]|uniref:hypothetical protein n=1 Tax=Streptomyces lunaelactis TaxID=1535768 RepID=UPI0015853E21|nr:hypothetical protein [Streptomyces lunaelactis]NUL13254.1 hypothetical protein [Streptomyces lunaelactis]